ncbi:hypothetical protein M5F04_04325 [Acinetobacter sp. ANC 7200]|uniref:hypothetical protein n=1 Tax=Acinetobacter amyesii TaxID=2942470 RepID=UPI0020C00986|nr:hypothetical protein [Acinetobacter amyesii]MCL6243800.1 hypothetical protein [Acinetobacter amyesii]
MNAVAEKFEPFEWLTKGITAKSPNFEPQAHGTGEKPLNYEDRLGAIASMETQLEKSVTSVIIFGLKSEIDYRCVQSHLAAIMQSNALTDGRREPEKIKISELADLMARMVIDFSLNPELEANFTKQGRLYYAGIRSWQMTLKAYDCTWKQYENLMVIALESAIDGAAKTIDAYRKKTYKESKI